MQPGAAPGRVTWSTGGDCLSHGGSRVAGCSPGLVGAEGPDLVRTGGPGLVGAEGGDLAWWEQWGDLASVLLVLSSSWPRLPDKSYGLFQQDPAPPRAWSHRCCGHSPLGFPSP